MCFFAVCARAWRHIHEMHVLRACTHTLEINIRYASDVCMLLQRSHSRTRARMHVISFWIHTRPMASFMPTHICTSSPKHRFIETFANLASQRCDLFQSVCSMRAIPCTYDKKTSCRLCGALAPRAVVHSVKFAEGINLRAHCPRFPFRRFCRLSRHSNHSQPVCLPCT